MKRKGHSPFIEFTDAHDVCGEKREDVANLTNAGVVFTGAVEDVVADILSIHHRAGIGKNHW